MNTQKVSRVLGIAFLFQFVTSVASGLFLRPAWLVPDNISETMLKIAGNPGVLRTNILLDMLTALGVIFLGSILFVTLRKQNEKIALVALEFYILGAGLLASSRIATFSLLHLSHELLETLRQRTGYSSQAVVEVFLYEGLIDDAIRALGGYPHYSTVELVVNAAIESRPDWCIQACKQQAEPIMDRGQSKYYQRAAYWLGRAKAAYLSVGRSDEWQAYLDLLLQKHARKYSLVPLIKELG